MANYKIHQKGSVVPVLVGMPTLVIVHGGETVVPASYQKVVQVAPVQNVNVSISDKRIQSFEIAVRRLIRRG